MKKSLYSVLFITLLSAEAFAKYQFVCDESYGMGVQQGFSGQIMNYEPSNPYCFTEGINYGKQVRSQYASEACNEAYNSGYKFGIEANVLIIVPPTDCSAAGYTYGTAQLTVSARAHDASVVGAPCVRAYQVGYSEGLKHEMKTSYSTNIESRCYQTGWSDSTK